MSFTLYDAVLGSSLTLRQIIDTGYQTAAAIVPGYFSAGLDPQLISGRQMEQRFTLSSTDLVGLLGGVDPQAGLSITDGITVPQRLAVNQGEYASGASHFALACTNGLLLVEQIEVNGQQNIARANCTVHCRSTDGLDPVTHSVTATLASQAFNAIFGLGKVRLTPESVAVFEPDVTGFRVGTQISLKKRRQSGLPAPTKIFIRRRQPFIDIGLNSLGDLATFGGAFKGMTSVDCYLRRYADGDTFEADASTVHGKVSFATGLIEAQRLRSGGIEDAEATVRLWGKSLSWSVVNAIP